MLALANDTNYTQSHTDKDNCRWSNLMHCPHRSMWHMEGRQHNRSYRDSERLLYVRLGESWSSPALLYIKAMHDSLTWGVTNEMHTSCVWGGNPTQGIYREEIKAEQRPMRVSEGETPIHNIAGIAFPLRSICLECVHMFVWACSRGVRLFITGLVG